LLAAVTVDVSQVVRAVDPQLLGVNATWWDTNLNTSQTQQMVQAAGMNLFRLPGGSSSDDFHFNAPPTYQGEGTVPSMASFVASVNGQAVVTLDYGSGSPQEAAAELAYLNAPVGATTPIGDGQEWNDNTSSWQTVNWQNAGYWASLRAATPLAVDDGLNFLRLGRTAPFDFKYFEVGNEEYGSWEIDHHPIQHDPTTYVAFAKQFQTYAATIDPSISIGIDAAAPDNSYNNWIANLLQQSVAQGLTVGFISDHNYVQAPGSESDSTLLLDTVSDPNSPDDWAVRAAGYTSLLNQYLGAAATNVELLTTEFNSVYSNPGKQTTSLVNGLFIADSLGELLQTSYDGATVWDLRNGYDTSENNSSSLYGWREGGDYGLIGSPSTAVSPPATGAYVPYPSYFAEQLASKIIQPGGNVVQASSDDPDLAVYAVQESDGDLDLLVINKSPSGPITGQFGLTGFQPAAQAQVWQYGEAQDTAQSQTSDGQSALASFTAALPVSGSSFSYSFPAYSMTVLDVEEGKTATGPTIAGPAAAAPNPVTGTSTGLSVAATDPAGASSLTYTWSTISPLSAGAVFSINATNAAQQTTAIFNQAGTYTFQVKVTDPSGKSATSDVTVEVSQALTSIMVSPTPVTVSTGTTQQFTAHAGDQFGNPMSTQPAFAWSLASGIGSINPTTGLYRAPGQAGLAVVEASSSGVHGTADVTVAPPRVPPVTVHYTDSDDWGTGFVGDIMITNTGLSTINTWTLQFNFAPVITSIWNATIVKHTGNQYTVANVSDDRTIAPGQSVSFGFQGRPGHAQGGPTGYIFNGVALPPPSTLAGKLKATATFTVTSQTESGFAATVTLTNTGTTTFGGWALQFDFAPPITSISNAAIARHAGPVYVIRDLGSNGVIAPGGRVKFQVRGSQQKLKSRPTGYVLDGVPISGSTIR